MRVTGILIYIQDLVYNNICKYEREFFDNIVSLLQSYHHPLVKGVSVCPASVNDRKHVVKKMSPTVLSQELNLEAFLPQDIWDQKKKTSTITGNVKYDFG